jgi:sigma-B regulation protein RsbU (phosphoserine phosphatase)
VALFEQRLGIRFEIVRFESWADVVEATRRREADVWFEAGITDERREFLDFTQPYIRFPAIIIVRQEETGSLGLDDLSGRTVAAMEGYATVDFLRENAPGVELIEVPSISDGLERVAFGSADAIVVSSGPASYYIEQLGLTNLRAAGESGFVWELAIGSRNDWPLLHSILAKTLASIGPAERRAIFRRWVSIDEPRGGLPWAWIVALAALTALGLGIAFSRRPGATDAAARSGTVTTVRVHGTWQIYGAGAAVIVIIAVLVGLAEIRIRDRLRQDVGTALQTVLNTTSQAVYHWFREHEEEAHLWATQLSVQRGCRQLGALSQMTRATLARAPAQQAVRSTLEGVLQQRGYLGYSLTSPSGVTIASDDEEQLGARASSPAVTMLLSSAQPGARSTTMGLPRLSVDSLAGSGTIRTPMLVAAVTEDDDPCVLSFVIDPERDFTQILQRGRMGESGESYAFNRDGQLLSDSRFDDQLRQIGLISGDEHVILNVDIRDPGGNLQRGHRAELPRDEQPLTLMAASATSGRAGSNLDGYNDYRGVPVIGAWVWDEANELGIATEIDAEEAYRSLGWIRGVVRAGGGFAMVLVLGLMGMFLRTRRLQQRASESWTRLILDSALDAVVMTDEDGIITFWNPQAERIFGWPADEARGRSLQDLVMTDAGTASRVSGIVRRSIADDPGALNRRVERLGRRRDGGEFPMELAVLPMQEGDKRSFAVFVRDITERKEAQETARHKERMESELNIGRDIQKSMLPLTFPAFPERREFTTFARLEPAREVGGDFYDFFFLDEDRFFFCVGDVSGKGVPSALFMAVTKTLIKSRANNDPSTGSILSYVNSELSESNEASMFVTLFAGILDVRSGELRYTNAGHNPPYAKRASDGSLVRLAERHGPVLGAVSGMVYGETSIQLDTGDLVFLYTDGLTEAMNPERELYTEERFAEWLRTNAATSVERLVDGIVSSVKVFESGAPQADDLTVLAVAYHGSGTTDDGPRTLDLELVNQFSEINRLASAFATFAEEHGVSQRLVRHFKMVFDELLNNTISHAYEDDGPHTIGVAVRLGQDRLTASITDDGVPFNPLKFGKPLTEASIDEREIGGLGIHLVRNVMDEVHYQRAVGQNIVSVVKYLRRPDG